MKTNKSYKKRLKVTKNGKIVARRPGQNHFNAKESSSERLLKKRSNVDSIDMSNKAKSRFLSNI
jgi:ribosomal protein L35